MNITIRSVHYDIAPDIRTRVESKIEAASKLLGSAEGNALVAVELARVAEHRQSGEIYEAIVNIDTGHRLIRATATAETMENAIDKAEAELLHELRNQKGKSRGLIRRTGSKMKDWMRGWTS